MASAITLDINTSQISSIDSVSLTKGTSKTVYIIFFILKGHFCPPCPSQKKARGAAAPPAPPVPASLFTVMPFGLTNASATFQRMMGNILKGVKGCLILIDDIIVFSETWKEHQRILEEVLSRIRAAGLKVKRDKCQFAQESVKFLGHCVCTRNRTGPFESRGGA